MNPYNPEIHHRRSVRLKNYDYSQPGAYFLTICTQNRECLFGTIVGANCVRPGSEIILNEFGDIVRDEWLITTEMRLDIKLDEYAVMPNHFHAIVIIPDVKGDRDTSQGDQQVAPTGGRRTSIRTLMAGYKSVVTKKINELRGTPGSPIWQRNYYEHVIRTETELNQIRQYIIDNPLKWSMDDENPEYRK